MIVLLGAQVTYAHQHIHFFQGDRQLLAQSAAGREKLALHTLLLVGRNFYSWFRSHDRHRLATHLQIPAGVVKEFMDMFAESGWCYR